MPYLGSGIMETPEARRARRRAVEQKLLAKYPHLSDDKHSFKRAMAKKGWN